MANKNISILLIVIAVFTLSVMSVMASVTVVSPGASAIVSGTYILNASQPNGMNMSNCTFYVKSSSTASTSWTSIGTFSNSSVNITHINGTFNSGTIEDASDYIFNASCYATNATYYEGTRSGITIDNSIPDTPTLSPTSGTRDTDGSVTFTGTVNGSETTSCTLYFDGINPGSSSYSMTHSGSSCTYTASAMPEQSYKWYVQATDGRNTTNSATNTIIVDVNTGGAKGGALWYLDQQSNTDQQTLAIASEQDKANNTALVVVIILVVITVAFVINKRR